MRFHRFMCIAVTALLLPAAASADDPRDPTMRSAAARARDREIIRKLNLKELARVRALEARGELGWHIPRNSDKGSAVNASYAAQSSDYERAKADYARDRAQYERDMAAWRRAVAACRQGDYSACDN